MPCKMQGRHTGELLAAMSKIKLQPQNATAPVYRHADRHPGFDPVFFDSAEEGKVGVGYGGVRGVGGAAIFFVGFGKVGVGGVYAGDDADGVRDVALHLQLRSEILGRGHWFDAGVRVVPAQSLHTVFIKLCAAFKDLHVADFHSVRPQLLRVPARVLICTDASRAGVKHTARTCGRRKSAQCKWCAGCRRPCPRTCPCSHSRSRTARGVIWRTGPQPVYEPGNRLGASASAI